MLLFLEMCSILDSPYREFSACTYAVNNSRGGGNELGRICAMGLISPTRLGYRSHVMNILRAFGSIGNDLSKSSRYPIETIRYHTTIV